MSDPTDPVRLLATVLAAGRPGSLPEQLCARATDVLRMDGAVVTLLSPPDHRHVVCASGDAAVRADDVQFTVGDGPVVEAFRDHVRVLVADLPAEAWARWPGFAEVSPRWPGYAAVFAFPLRLGDDRPLGVLALYRHRAGAMPDAAADEAGLIADAMALALVRPAPTAADDPGLEVGPTRWSGAEQVVHQAVGMVVAQLRVEPTEALTRLRAHAFAVGRSLDQVALDVVERRLRLET